MHPGLEVKGLMNNSFAVSTTVIVFNPFYKPIKSLLLGIKYVLKQQDLQIKQIQVVFAHLKLWVTVARRNFHFVL